MKLRKILTTFLSLTMLSAAVPITSQAKLTSEAGGEKAKVKLVLLKEDATAKEGYSEITTDKLEKTKDSTFYAGILTENFSRIQEVKDYVGTAAGASKNGLNMYSFGVSYDAEYLQFEPDAYMDLDSDGTNEFFVAGMATQSISDRLQYTDSIFKKSAVWKYDGFDETLIAPSTEISPKDVSAGFDTRVVLSTKNAAPATHSHPYSGAGPDYMAIIKFKFIKDGSNLSDGTKILGFSNSDYKGKNESVNGLQFGTTTVGQVLYQDEESGTSGDYGTQDIRAIIEFVDAQLYPAGAKKAYQISTKSTNTITNATQYVGSAFSNAGIALQLDKRANEADTEIEHEDIALTDSKLVFKYVAKDTAVADIAAATALTTVPATWAAGDAGDKDIYAVYDGKYFVKVGTVTVAEASINAITNVTGASISNAVEGGTIQFPTGATIVVKKTDSTTATHNITKGNWASNNLGIYKVTGTGASKTYTLVDESTVKFSAGANTFVAAVKPASGNPTIMGSEFTITAKAKATLNLAAATTNKTYGDASTAVSATATATTAGTALDAADYQVLYKKTTDADAAYSTTVPTNAGTYNVKIALTTAGGNKYVIDPTTSTVQTGTLVIAQKEVTVGLTVPTTGAVYGAAEADRKATATISGATLAAADYEVQYKSKATGATWSTTVPANAGEYDVQVVIKNGNYKASTTSTTTGTLTIAQKEITISEVTVDKVQAGTIGPGLTKDGTHTVTAAEGKVGNDNLIFNFTATYNAADVATATDAVVNATVTAKTPALTIGGQAASNYKLGTGTITGKGGVSSKPAIVSVSPFPITATVAASDSANTSVAALAAKLPTTVTATYNDGTGNKTVTLNVAWTSENTFVATGATYTYKATLSGSDVVDLGYNLPATVEVTEVEASYPTNAFGPVQVAVDGDNSSHAALGLATSVKITVNGTEYDCPVIWTEASTTLDTSVENASATFNGTVDLSSLPSWVKKPSASVTQTATVGSLPVATDLTDASKQAIADLIKEYSAADGKTLADFEAALAGLTLKVTDGTTEYDATAAWEWTKNDPADEFDPQGGEYVYTATLTSTEAKVDGITAPTVTFKVNGVTAEYPENAFANKNVNKNGDNSSHAALGLTTSVTITVNGTEYECPVIWTEAANTLDVTKAGNTATFNGTVDFSSLPAWVTPPSASVTQTVTVKDTDVSSPSRAGGGSSYVVTFDAGKDGKITKGNKTARVSKGSSMKETALPTVTANEGYKFVGWSLDGETVDPTTLKITKAITLKAVYEEDIEETPAPTDAPVINPEYTKPYAGGYDEGDFRPDNNITRAELAAMIARLSYEDELPDGMYSASFWDVDSNAWYNKYIGYLEGLRVFDGYEDGSFQPEKNVTRSELCAVLVRAQKFIITPQDGMFWDVTENEWARDYISTLAQRGIVSGYNDGSFGPYQPLTRAETVTMINKVLDPSTPIVTFTPWDISGHWAENEILLAVNEREVIGSEPEPTEAPEETVEPEAEATDAPEETVEPEAEATEAPEA